MEPALDLGDFFADMSGAAAAGKGQWGFSNANIDPSRLTVFKPAEEGNKAGKQKAAGSKKMTESYFASLGLAKGLVKACEALGYVTATEIQEKVVPLVLKGADVLAGAVTGSGKTAAFALPILHRLLYRNKALNVTWAVVLTPTRELCQQTCSMVTALAQFTDIRVEAIIGGSNSLKEQRKLTSAPDVLIATPGRLLDHLKNTRGISLDYVQFLVLDEADRLLDMGFRDEVLGILGELPEEHQTTLTSATLSSEVDRFAKETLRHPVKVTRGKDKLDVPASLQAFIVRMQEGWSREAVLLTLLTDYFKSQVIVFFHTKKQCHRFWLILNELNMSAAEIQGDLSQAQRLTAISSFQSSQVDFLIATDLAARGLDLPVAAVINCQVPKEAKRLIHRMGRTARAGESGMSVTLCSDQERTMLKKAVKGMKVKAIRMPGDKVQKWGKKVQKLRPKITDKLAEEEAEKEFTLAEIEQQKAHNFIIHSDEIYNRPRREWIHSKRQKEVLKKSNFEGEEKPERRPGERDIKDKVSGNPLMVKNSRASSRGMREKDVKKGRQDKVVKKNRKEKTHVKARKTVGKAFKSEKRYKRR